MVCTMNAVRFWDEALKEWKIPEDLLATAPESPFGFDAEPCNRLTDETMRIQTPSRRRAREALPDGGTVLDVGCGAGVASLSLAVRAAGSASPNPATVGHAVGVDQQEDMLAAFAARAESLGVAHEEVHGCWPDVAGAVPDADVVVCHHVLYNVAALEPFVLTLTAHARQRVVIEIPTEHPLAWLRPLWQSLHSLDRPTRPTVDDAVAAIRELGLAVEMERWFDPFCSPRRQYGDSMIEHVRRRLCLPTHREPEIRELLRELDLPREGRAMATLWWSPASSAGPFTRS